MKIAFNPSTVAALTTPPNNKDITFDLRGRNIFARGVKFYGTDTNTWRDIKINNVSIGSYTLDLRNGSNTTLTNTNGVVTINSTWRPVVDNLTSDSTTSSLSAKQGKVLKALIDGKSNSDHNHDDRYVKKSGDTMQGVLTIDTTNFGALTIKRDDDAYAAAIQFRGKSSVYGYIGLNNSTKDKQFLRWNSDTSRSYFILDTSSTYISNGKGVINGATITQVDNATNATNATNTRKLVNWYSARPTSLNVQFGDGSLRIFYATSSTTEGKPAADSHILHLAWDNTDGYDAQLAVHRLSGKVSTRAQNVGTWQPWKTLAFTTDIPSSLKNPYSLTTFGVVYDGSAAKTVTTSNFISQVIEGFSTVTDGTMFITSCASNSGFADTNAINVPYKRKAIHLWEYIKAKTDSLYATEGHNHDDRYVRYYTVTTLDCNNLAAGLTAARISATNAAHINHSAYLYISDVGTPFQIQIPDANIRYIYKRYYGSGKWSEWFKLNAGYADSAGSVAWANVTGKPSSYTPSAHTHAWNSLTHSSTTENQAILTNGEANGWKLQTLNIARWDNAANNAHSHANKSVLDGITSALVNSWNTAYNFVSNITGTDTDKVINKWEEIVNFLAGITEDNKLNTLLNSKLSVYELADNTDVGTIKNNGIYYSTTDASSRTLINSPFNTGFAFINMTSYDGGDELRRSRLALNAFGEIKVSDDRDQANTAETWYNVLTSKNSGINGSTIKLNGTSITVCSSDTADGRYVRAFGTSNDNINSDWGQSFKTFDPIPSGTPPEQNPNISILNIGENFNRRKQLAFIWSNDNIYYRRHMDSGFTNWRRLAFLDSKVADSDKLDGVHLNGIFTGFSYAQSRLTATIGTVSKTINVTGSYPSIDGITMNTIASYGNCMGMANLASSNSNVNPNNQTSWHHFINMSYNTESTNMWQTQFAIKAGTTEVWVRSRAGGSISDSSAWAAPWVRLARITDNIASATNADMVDGYHENSFLRYRGATNTDQEATLWSQIGIKQYSNALPDNLTGVYNYGSVISLPGLSSRFEIYASHQSSYGNGLYYRSGWGNDKKAWLKFIDSSNIGSQSVNYANSAGHANSAGNADTLGGIPRNYGQAPFGTIPSIGNDGVMEIGNYIDFHSDNSGSYDYSTRIQANGNYENTVNLPSKSGTLALTSYGGEWTNPKFLGYLTLNSCAVDVTVNSKFCCLGHVVPFTYTGGGNYCEIQIPDTTSLTFYIQAAIASIVSAKEECGTLQCQAFFNEVRVIGFRNGSIVNPLHGNDGVYTMIVCIFGCAITK